METIPEFFLLMPDMEIRIFFTYDSTIISTWLPPHFNLYTQKHHKFVIGINTYFRLINYIHADNYLAVFYTITLLQQSTVAICEVIHAMCFVSNEDAIFICGVTRFCNFRTAKKFCIIY